MPIILRNKQYPYNASGAEHAPMYRAFVPFTGHFPKRTSQDLHIVATRSGVSSELC